jgi:hypothetical protein
MKKTLLLLAVSCFLISAPSFGQDFYYDQDTDSNSYFNETVDIGEELKAANTDDEDSILNQLLAVFDLDSDQYDGDDKAVRYAKGVINLALSLASFATLIRLLYGFYAMFFSKQEEGFSRARKIVR